MNKSNIQTIHMSLSNILVFKNIKFKKKIMVLLLVECGLTYLQSDLNPD